ncbi:hypothetical protein [Asanoa ishikariensis]|uniref:hypothetical protein n=1 Tax=Asanoa ishikariensis TaxID=137265 RepID=UPI00115FE0D3|nr:hypothetical protein [Asanoa ishikariensis]
MTVASHGRPAMEGPLIYGVWLRWGLLYVGQTREGERRLRDLPVGESHHLANTFPPEIWHKVVVIAWPRLAEAERLAGVLQPDLVGLALEHRLQNELRPLANSERRKSDGSWREVDWRASSSRGARTAHAVDDLFHAVRQVWDEAASRSEQDEHASAVCRVVFPETLLPQD